MRGKECPPLRYNPYGRVCLLVSWLFLYSKNFRFLNFLIGNRSPIEEGYYKWIKYYLSMTFVLSVWQIKKTCFRTPLRDHLIPISSHCHSCKLRNSLDNTFGVMLYVLRPAPNRRPSKVVGLAPDDRRPISCRHKLKNKTHFHVKLKRGKQEGDFYLLAF